jgi:hypothetical protein
MRLTQSTTNLHLYAEGLHTKLHPEICFTGTSLIVRYTASCRVSVYLTAMTKVIKVVRRCLCSSAPVPILFTVGLINHGFTVLPGADVTVALAG